MPPQPDIAGYALYLLFIFLPGIGAGELLGLWRGQDTLGERLGFALGLGLALDTVVMVVRTSGVTVFGSQLRGIDQGTIYAVVLAGASAIVISALWRRNLAFPTRPKATDLFLFLAVAAIGLMVTLYFQKYPIFPEFQSADFGAHVQFAEGLASGSVASVPAGILYYGVHLQLASALELVGGEPLVTVQQTMGLLVILSPLLLYCSLARIFRGRGPALVATSIFVLSGTVWYSSVFDAGLYANFFGILMSLFLLIAFADLSERVRSKPLWLVFLAAVAASYFSHYTTATLIPSLLVVPLVRFLRNRADYMRFLIPSVAAIAPAALAVIASPGLPARALFLAESGGGTLVGSTSISSALSAFPVASYMAFLAFDDLGFFFLLLFAAFGTYRLVRSGTPMSYVLMVWLLALLVAAPFNVSAWRFSLEALVPFTFLASFGVYSLLPKLKMVRKGKFTGHWKLGIVLFLLFTPLVVFSRAQTFTADSLTGTQDFSTVQGQVYTALYWLKDNTPANSSYLSVSDPRFQYSSLVFGRLTYYGSIPYPDAAIQIAQRNGTQYIVVTRLVYGEVSPSPWVTFPTSSTSNLTLVYSNPDVRVCQLP